MPNRRRRQMTKKKTAAVRILMSCILLAQVTDLRARSFDARSGVTKWPTHGWAKGKPSSVGLDEKILSELDGDLASGKYSLVDSFAVFRCGTSVYERTYSHDYGQIYGKEAKTRGPLNAHLTGPYNYFDPAWHPYYHGTDLHSMQSVSKTVTSVILGIAITRGDFKAGLDTPLLKYFDVAAVKNVDDRKRRITLQHVLTMTTGLDWNEEVAYDDPKNDSSLMEATDDWVQYVIAGRWPRSPERFSTTAAACRNCWLTFSRRRRGRTLRSTARNICSLPWAWSITGSGRRWEWLISREVSLRTWKQPLGVARRSPWPKYGFKWCFPKRI